MHNSTGLFRLTSTERVPRRLTAEESIDLAESSELTFTDDGSVIVQNTTRGTVQLMAVSPHGQISQITSTALVVTGHDCVGDKVVFAFQDAMSSGDVAVVADNHIRRLTGLGSSLRDDDILPSREVTVIGRDGCPVHGWVVRPKEHSTEGPGAHPVLLCIHGGPFSQYSVALFDEAQICAAAGYAVVMCNPRGSSGYGQAHGRAIRHGMGQLDQNDVLDFLDGVLDTDPTLDATRVGIMGGSYGGFLTAWIIANDHRFTTSVIERGFLDPEAFIGTSDIGSFFTDEYAGETQSHIQRQSPQSVVGSVRTPTLLTHSANDLRCPLGQSERYYAALKRGGVETELVIFPGEDHELSRKGSPRHREQRFAIVLEWLARYLPTAHNAR
ncbi:alpha/beta hydrolase family protein [Leifsonia sp. A12D58]|uniref:alpha/beta hydrolase family protein n=1 Tax=Leifsonia sp. A12D58 TaxID=3397674 RepID=UPI0039DF72BC